MGIPELIGLMVVVVVLIVLARWLMARFRR